MLAIIILGLLVLLLLLYIFIHKNEGECRWWQHKWSNWEKEDYFVDTDKYIEGKSIQRKTYRYWHTCSKCYKREDDSNY